MTDEPQTAHQVIETILIPKNQAAVSIPDGAKVLDAGFVALPQEEQRIVAPGRDQKQEPPQWALVVWVLLRPDLPRRQRLVMVVQSGQPIPISWKLKHWATAQGPVGTAHVLELTNADALKKRGHLQLVKDQGGKAAGGVNGEASQAADMGPQEEIDPDQGPGGAPA